MKALISPLEPRSTGYRVAQIHETGFDVAEPLFWVDCPNDLIEDQKWYDPSDNTFKDAPILPAAENQPTTSLPTI